MDPARRLFLTAFVPGVVLAGASSLGAASARATQDPVQNPSQPRQNPNSPGRAVLPPPAVPPTSAQLRQNQRDIRKDVDELFSLAQELKSLAAKSDASEELSVGLIQKTDEIEKLAKKIRDLARY
ncbi:MAG: hypothetical protein WAN10_03790 [Candidatus Acidiferrales bacterium]